MKKGRYCKISNRCVQSGKYFLISVFYLLVILINGNAVEAGDVVSNNVDVAQTLSLIQFHTLTNTIHHDLIVLQNTVENINLVKITDKIPSITQQIDQVDWEMMMAVSNTNVNISQLSEIRSRLAKIKARINRVNRDIQSNINLLENELKIWGKKEEQLDRSKALVTNLSSANLSMPTIDLQALEQLVAEAKTILKTHIVTSLELGEQTGKQLSQVYKISVTLTNLTEDVYQSGREQTTPSMFSGDFYYQFDLHLLHEGWDTIKLFSSNQLRYLKKYRGTVIICLLSTLLLAILIYLTKPRQQTLRWYSFSSSPITTAILFSGTAFISHHVLAIDNQLPPGWYKLLFIPLVLTIAFYPDILCTTPYQRKLLRIIIIIFPILQILYAVKVPRAMLYMFVFFTSIVGLIYYIQLLFRRKTQQPPLPIPWQTWLGVSITLTVIICGAAGYDQLAVDIFIRFLSIIVFTLLMTLIFFAVTGLLELLLFHCPVAIIRKNTTVIIKNITPVFILMFSILWIAVILVFLWVYPSLVTSIEAIRSIAVTIGNVSITPWLLICIVIVGYAIRLFSQGINTILIKETLPRLKVDKGVQMSITRLVHYTVMFIGFLIILYMLGFGLGQVTLIGGALGVGIGFGLKEIVNNFVSGLILLFERPVKVGDIIAIGEDWGEIQTLGLRATTVQTFDNAEIVIPNSELIIKNVTNWTLGSKRVRVKVQVGVAYGSDIEKVLQILISCGDANPIVLTQPGPSALFLNFGESSLDFELRVWISDISDRMQVLSELNQDIESELSMNNIEIPFPQRDLHLRSIDETCVEALKDRKGGSSFS